MASGITWLRGGQWTLPPQPAGLDLRVILPAPNRSRPPIVRSLSSLLDRNQDLSAPPFSQPLQARLEHRQNEAAAQLFYSDPDRWAEEVGEPCGLQRYELTVVAAWRMLAEITALVDSAPDPDVSFDERPDLEHLIDECLRITEKYGPLGEVPGVVEMGPHRRHHEEKAMLSFDLFGWWLEVGLIAATYNAFRGASKTGSKRALFDFMQKHARDDLREVELVPVLRRGSFSFWAVPLTLRALLWQLMFGRLNSPTRGVCLECQRTFDIAIARGPAPEYCPDHKTSKYRMRVKARVAAVKNRGK